MAPTPLPHEATFQSSELAGCCAYPSSLSRRRSSAPASRANERPNFRFQGAGTRVVILIDHNGERPVFSTDDLQHTPWRIAQAAAPQMDAELGHLTAGAVTWIDEHAGGLQGLSNQNVQPLP
jgi:hypothetical protein